jgi:putative transposase
MGDSADRVIKNRPHRLNLVYTNQPLYFVTFATRDRKKLVSLQRAQLALEAYGQRAANKFNVALGRYVIMPDHVHLCLSIPPKYSVAHTLGFLKGKSAVRVHRELLREKRMTGLHFWATGYWVSTVGRDEESVRKYIREQEGWDRQQGELFE